MYNFFVIKSLKRFHDNRTLKHSELKKELEPYSKIIFGNSILNDLIHYSDKIY